jgi:hypothetical protein
MQDKIAALAPVGRLQPPAVRSLAENADYALRAFAGLFLGPLIAALATGAMRVTMRFMFHNFSNLTIWGWPLARTGFHFARLGCQKPIFPFCSFPQQLLNCRIRGGRPDIQWLWRWRTVTLRLLFSLLIER